MSVDLSPASEWMLCYAGEVARLMNRLPDADECQGAYEQFGADHTPEECAREDMVDGAR